VLTMQDELVAPLLVQDRLHRVELRLLSRAVPHPPDLLTHLLGAIGHLLVAAGARLESLARASRTGRTWLLTADLCPDCGA
jgi:hypothetical protein